jgi:putative lipoprotein
VTDRRREPAIVFDEASATFSGSTGCNRLIGQFIAENATLELEPGGTLTACRNETQTEAAMLGAIKNTRTYRITGRVLELFDEKGARLARFQASLATGATVR